jgi:hypothetical protein
MVLPVTLTAIAASELTSGGADDVTVSPTTAGRTRNCTIYQIRVGTELATKPDPVIGGQAVFEDLPLTNARGYE